MIDFSFIQNIDFKNADNLIFLSVFLVIFLIFLFVIITVLAELIRIIRVAIRRIFKIEPSPKMEKDQSHSGQKPQELHNGRDELTNLNPKIPAPVITIQGNPNEGGGVNNEDTDESREEKEQENIDQSLAALKYVGGSEGEGLQSKMPSLDNTASTQEQIKVPQPKSRILGGDSIKNSDSEVEKKIEARKDMVQSRKQKEENSIAKNLKALKSSSKASGGAVASKITAISDEPGGNNYVVNLPAHKDGSIFSGKNEISRSELRQELQQDMNVFKAERDVGLTMSPVQRAKLEKEVFASSLGRNISKTDLKRSIKKLNEKIATTKDAAAHAKLTREVKFFKKIGGIK